MKDEQEIQKNEDKYLELLQWIDYATYYQLQEIARKSYHLKMEKERMMARKHVD